MDRIDRALDRRGRDPAPRQADHGRQADQQPRVAAGLASRYREERGQKRDKGGAIHAAGPTASRAVLFSGSAFVVAMFGMLLVPSSIMRSLATGAILVGVVSVVGALTLLPALLGLIADRVNARASRS